MIPSICLPNVYVMYMKRYKLHRIPDSQFCVIVKVYDLQGQPSSKPFPLVSFFLQSEKYDVLLFSTIVLLYIILLLLLKCLSVNVRFWRTQIHNNNTISSMIN